MKLPIVAFATLLAVLPALSGCLGGSSGTDEPVDDGPTRAQGRVPVQERASLPFDTSGDWSVTLDRGVFEILPVESVFVPVDVPATEGGAGLTMDAQVHLGLWLPGVPEGEKVPIIADVGPYYIDGDTPATEPANRLGRFLIENFVPHGYGVAQVSVFGSGLSNHCMDLMGTSEQLGINAAVEWLGTQEWSNGKVALIGRSYDGSTPWEAATFGNDHLATIVPISGLIGMHDLMWRNGSAEFRAPIMHNVVYGTFGLDSDPMAGSVDPEDAQTACVDYLTGPVEGVAGYATGDYVAPDANSYWIERSFLDRALQNYKGSIYLIHGLQDWNVDNHMAFPTYHILEDAGFEVKGLFGQWAHMYPDRPGEHDGLPEGRGAEAFPESVRYDWAQDLLEWFDYYLKGVGPKPSLHAEVQDNQGAWRIEGSYPPRDATEMAIGFDQMTKLHTSPDIVFGFDDPLTGQVGTGNLLGYQTATFEEETRIAGNVYVDLMVTPDGEGGQIYAFLRDAGTGLHVGHGILDLRFAHGGKDMQPVTPGMPMRASIELFALDAVLPAGTSLIVELTVTGDDYLPPSTNVPVSIDTSGASVLRIPTVERAPEVFFEPPAWSGEAATAEQQP